MDSSSKEIFSNLPKAIWVSNRIANLILIRILYKITLSHKGKIFFARDAPAGDEFCTGVVGVEDAVPTGTGSRPLRLLQQRATLEINRNAIKKLAPSRSDMTDIEQRSKAKNVNLFMPPR